MAGALRDHGGGIAGLRRLLTEHPEAIRYELLRLGLRPERVGTRHLSWLDLKAVVVSLPPGNALHRSIDPEEGTWAAGAANPYLLAVTVDLLAAANWQRGGGKSSRRPRPIPRPGLKDGSKRWGGRKTAVTQREVDARLAAFGNWK